MKKLLLPLFAAALAMSGCNLQNHFSFDQIEFDYPASWEVVGKDVDEDQMTIMLSVSDEDIRSIFIEVVKENPESIADADPEILAKYLCHRAHDIAETFIPDEADIEENPDDEGVIEYLPEDDETYHRAVATFHGTYEGGAYCSCVMSILYENLYTITAYVQGASMDEIDDIIEKCLRTVHEK